MSLPNNSLPTAQTYTEMTDAGNELPGWLWQRLYRLRIDHVAHQPWKTGKTTLLSVLLSRLQTGGVLAGSEVAAGHRP